MLDASTLDPRLVELHQQLIEGVRSTCVFDDDDTLGILCGARNPHGRLATHHHVGRALGLEMIELWRLDIDGTDSVLVWRYGSDGQWRANGYTWAAFSELCLECDSLAGAFQVPSTWYTTPAAAALRAQWPEVGSAILQSVLDLRQGVDDDDTSA